MEESLLSASSSANDAGGGASKMALPASASSIWTFPADGMVSTNNIGRLVSLLWVAILSLQCNAIATVVSCESN